MIMKKLIGNSEISRRQFIEMASKTAGFVALSSAGVISGWAENFPQVDANKLEYQENETDVLVVGGGMAGLFAAVKAHDAGSKVILVSKGRLGSSGSTPFAKGIFSFDPATAKVSLDEFVETVSRSALGTNNPVYTRQMAENSFARVKDLKGWGFFDSPLYNNAFSKPLAERNIPVMERIVITHLIKENGRIAGAAGFSLDEENVRFFKAKSVILCTGAGGFKPNGFPICDLTHDGTIMAYKIGAKVTGKEWNDGHPGQAINAAACFDGWHGMFERKPGLTGVEVHHDLGVDLNYAAYMNGNPVQMGPPGSGGNNTTKGGPYIPEEFRRSGPQEEAPQVADLRLGVKTERVTKKVAHLLEWGGQVSEVLLQVWPYTNQKVLFLLMINANPIFLACMLQEMPWAHIWRELYIPRLVLRWPDRLYKVLLRQKLLLNIVKGLRCPKYQRQR